MASTCCRRPRRNALHNCCSRIRSGSSSSSPAPTYGCRSFPSRPAALRSAILQPTLPTTILLLPLLALTVGSLGEDGWLGGAALAAAHTVTGAGRAVPRHGALDWSTSPAALAAAAAEAAEAVEAAAAAATSAGSRTDTTSSSSSSSSSSDDAGERYGEIAYLNSLWGTSGDSTSSSSINTGGGSTTGYIASSSDGAWALDVSRPAATASSAVVATGAAELRATPPPTRPPSARPLPPASRATPPPPVRKPCRESARVTIAVRSAADIGKRVLYPPTTSVTLLLQNSLRLTTGLVFASNYSCTILQPAPSAVGKKLSIYYDGSSMPVFTAFNTSNILVTGISLSFKTGNSSQPCLDFGPFQDARQSRGQLCPGVLIVRSFGIQITKGSVFGRLDVFKSMYVTLDSLSVTMPLYAYSTSHPWYSFDTLGIIRVGSSGVGERLLRSYITISNCEVYGGWELITLFKGAAGVTVRNNYLHDYYWAGVRCGAYSGYVMDCYLNTISYNYIVGNPNTVIIDSASVYFCTHWYNPGNVLKCNYMVGGVHCYYLDYGSSGVRIDGGVCKGTADTLKLNNGKFVNVRSLVIVDNPGVFYESFYISCITAKHIHCDKNGEGRYWKEMFNRHYNTPNVNRLYPYMATICPPPTKVNNASCNPNVPGALSSVVTGGCSGLPYANSLDFVMVNTAYRRGTTCSATEYPTMLQINQVRFINVTNRNVVGFLNPARDDFGLNRTSRIWRSRPKFTSCPRALAGRQPVKSNKAYFARYNIPRPYWFQDMLSFDGNKILNATLYLQIGIRR